MEGIRGMVDRPRAVVTDYDFPTLEPERAVLEAAGIELIPTQSKDEAELVANCRSADALLVEYAAIKPLVRERILADELRIL